MDVYDIAWAMFEAYKYSDITFYLQTDINTVLLIMDMSLNNK